LLLAAGILAPMNQRELRELFRREIRRDPARAVAVAVGPISELWVALLEALDHPNIGPEEEEILLQWREFILEGARKAMRAAACEMRVRNNFWPQWALSPEEPPVRKGWRPPRRRR